MGHPSENGMGGHPTPPIHFKSFFSKKYVMQLKIRSPSLVQYSSLDFRRHLKYLVLVFL